MSFNNYTSKLNIYTMSEHINMLGRSLSWIWARRSIIATHAYPLHSVLYNTLPTTPRIWTLGSYKRAIKLNIVSQLFISSSQPVMRYSSYRHTAGMRRDSYISCSLYPTQHCCRKSLSVCRVWIAPIGAWKWRGFQGCSYGRTPHTK